VNSNISLTILFPSDPPEKYLLHNKKGYEFCSSPLNLLMIVIKSRSIRWAGHVACMDVFQLN
jgi:hypothetical protein